MNIFGTIIRTMQREWLLSFRQRSDWLNPLIFFVLVVSLFPLGTTPDLRILHKIGPGIIWVAALLAILLSLPKLFQDDYHDGSLELLVLSPVPLAITAFSKVLAHWAMFCLPIVALAPLLGLMFHFSFDAMFVMMISLLLGTPILYFLGAIGAALTVGLRNQGLLLALLLLPLYVPPLIFGSAAVIATEAGRVVTGQLAILASMLALTLTLAPTVIAFALRIGIAY